MFISKIKTQTKGAAFGEYVTLVGLVGIISITAVVGLSGGVDDAFDGTSSILDAQGLTVAESTAPGAQAPGATAAPEAPAAPAGPTPFGDGITGLSHPMLLLGSPADIDPFEGNTMTENAGSIVGSTFGSEGFELYGNIVPLTANDADGDGFIRSNDNNSTAETFTNGGTTYSLDSAQTYGAIITYTDGTTAPVALLIIQMTTGEMFIAPTTSQNADYQAMVAEPLRSVSITNLNSADVSYTAQRVEMEYLIPAAL
ncbi:hypothetical protein [Oceaniglobus indicus]|uniref:hypothetical protein n=1 Tax=Oceaniglobus indicus TaxID=2047749 RepID=UPI0011AB5927|nr:hypothetical protein [Oceaniglobus indicus]